MIAPPYLDAISRTTRAAAAVLAVLAALVVAQSPASVCARPDQDL